MKNAKTWIMAGLVLTAIGIAVCGGSFAAMGFDFSKLGTGNFVTNTYDVSGEFSSISINADTEKVTFTPSEDSKCKVVCYEEEKSPHKVEVKDKTLKIENTDRSTFHFGIWTDTPTITVYLPQGAYKDLLVDTDTGDVKIPEDYEFETVNLTLDTGDVDCSAAAIQEKLYVKTDTGRVNVSNAEVSGDIEIKVNTGKVNLENIICRNLRSKGSTGSITMTNLIADGEINIERDTGDVRFDGCDAETIYVETDTGDVTGTLLSEKVFAVDTDTGKAIVPKTLSGGRCEITSDTGDIKIEIK